jgi:peroxiredoxin
MHDPAKTSGGAANARRPWAVIRDAAATAALWCLAIVVLGHNLILHRQLQSMRAQLAPPIPTMDAGSRLYGLAGTNMEGRLVRIEWPATADQHLLLITFSPGCPACRANQKGWSALSTELKNRGWHVLWVSRDTVEQTKEYCAQQAIDPSDVLAEPPYGTYIQLKLQTVPFTILVGDHGTIQRSWGGSLPLSTWRQVFSYVQLTEPKELEARVP